MTDTKRKEIEKNILKFGLNQYDEIFELTEGWNDVACRTTPNGKWEIQYSLNLTNYAEKQTIINTETHEEHEMWLIEYDSESEFLALTEIFDYESMTTVEDDVLFSVTGLVIDDEGNFVEKEVVGKNKELYKIFQDIIESERYTYELKDTQLKELLKNSTLLCAAIVKDETKDVEKYLVKTITNVALGYHSSINGSLLHEWIDEIDIDGSYKCMKKLDFVSSISYDVATVYLGGTFADQERMTWLTNNLFKVANYYNINLIKNLKETIEEPLVQILNQLAELGYLEEDISDILSESKGEINIKIKL